MLGICKHTTDHQTWAITGVKQGSRVSSITQAAMVLICMPYIF